MKKLLLILLTFISLDIFAQIKVKEGSFHQINGYVMMDKNEHLDMNNSPMALIKISTENIKAEERRRITFKGNLATYFDVHFEPTEIHLYITAKAATFIEIHHPDYGKTEFTLPYDLKDFCGYEMVLQYVPIGNDSDLNYLILKADQQDARIYVDDEYVGKQFAHKQLVIGTNHSWRIECELFRTENGNITITNKENIVDVTMLPEFGYLNVTTTPENGAKVYINDSLVGKSPYKSDKLSVGDYIVKVTKDNFKTAEKAVAVNDKKTTEENIEMQLLCGSLEISSNPTNADVYIDGKHYGKTPRRITEIIIGTHELKLGKNGCAPITKTIKIKKGETLTINEKLPTGKEVVIKTGQKGDKIYIDGSYAGMTPLTTKLSYGKHDLKATRGTQTATNSIEVKIDNIKEEYTLSFGKMVRISSDKPGDKIYVSDNYIGITPLTVNLSYGKHNVKAVRGSQVSIKNVHVTESDGVTNVRFDFGKIIKIQSSVNGDKIFLDGKKVGSSPMNLELSLGSHKVKVKRGLKKDVRTLNISTSSPNTYYFSPWRETYRDYFRNGIHFIALDVYPFIEGMGIDGGDFGGIVPGLTYGMKRGGIFEYGWGLGWSLSISPCLVMANISWFILDFGLGVDYNGEVLWNIGEIFSLKRITIRCGFVTTKNNEYMYIGLGYNFKHW